MCESRKPHTVASLPRGRRSTRHAVAPPLVGGDPRIALYVYNAAPARPLGAKLGASALAARFATSTAQESKSLLSRPTGVGHVGTEPAGDHKRWLSRIIPVVGMAHRHGWFGSLRKR